MPHNGYVDRPERSFLIIRESEVVRPDNWQADNLSKFVKVFSWKNVTSEKNNVVVLPLPNKLDFPREWAAPELRRKKIALVAANKKSNYPSEQYSARRRYIDHFSRSAPEWMDLYGVGWDRPAFTNSHLRRVVRVMGPISKIFCKVPEIYCGPVKRKHDLLEKYYFSLCIENGDIGPDYITEKIFDSLIAGTVPIYLGADNVADYIPSDIFFNLRQYSDCDALVRDLDKVGEGELRSYQNRIRSFLTGEGSRRFSAEHFAETVAATVAEASP
jgi:hypothetical protein